MSNRKKLIIMVITFSLILIISSSYALLRSTKVSENNYSITIGDLKVIFKDGQTEKLNLTNIYPMTDEEGMAQEDVLSFTIENTGTVGSYYDISIEETSTSPEFKSVIKYISNKDNDGYTEPKILSEDKYIEFEGFLESGATRTYKVKAWLAEEADNTYMGKTFKAKISLNAYQESNYAKDVIKAKLVKYEESSKEDFTGGLVAVNKDGELYNETDETEEIREYRYSGPNVNNYVTFNDENWRIIGVFKDEDGNENIKLVRGDFIDNSIIPVNYTKNLKNYNLKGNDKSDGVNYYNYDTVNTTLPSNDWTTAGLQYYLNTEKDDSETENYGYLHYINEDSKKMIKKSTYYLGNISTIDNPERNEPDVMVKANEAYVQERGNVLCDSSVTGGSHNKNCNVWSTNKASWNGEIALLYPSDYGYSVNSNFWTNTTLYNYKQEANKTSWLEIYKAMWLLSPISANNYSGTICEVLNVNDVIVSNKLYYVLPTLYLKSNVKIISGDGTINNQYKLSI